MSWQLEALYAILREAEGVIGRGGVDVTDAVLPPLLPLLHVEEGDLPAAAVGSRDGRRLLK